MLFYLLKQLIAKKKKKAHLGNHSGRISSINEAGSFTPAPFDLIVTNILSCVICQEHMQFGLQLDD